MSLRSRIIAITQPRDRSVDLARLIAEEGGSAYIAPTFNIKPILDNIACRKIIDEKADYAIFLSVSSPRILFEKAEGLKLVKELRDSLNQSNVVAIGPKTKSMLEINGVSSCIPEEYSSKGIINMLRKRDLLRKEILIFCSLHGGLLMQSELKKLGGITKRVPTHEVVPGGEKEVENLARNIIDKRIDCVVFTCPRSFTYLIELASRKGMKEKLISALSKIDVAVIGPVTREELRKEGIEPNIMPDSYTIEALASSIKEHFRNHD